MEKEKDPLLRLILNDELNKEVLASILESFVKIDLQNGQIILLSDYSKLSNKEQVLIVLLAFKVLRIWNLRKEVGVSPKEIEQITQLAGSTTRGALRDLFREKLVICEKGKYNVPNFLLYLLKDKFLAVDLEKRIEKKEKRVGQRIQESQREFVRIKTIMDTSAETFEDFLNFLIDNPGKYLEKSLLILKIAKEKFNIDGLTPAEITEILRNKIRVSRIHQSNISLYLGNTKNSRYVFRETSKSGYIYKLTKLGEDFVNNMNFKLKEKLK